MNQLINPDYFLDKLRELHLKIRNTTLEQLRFQEDAMEKLSEVGGTGSGDISYKIDLPAESILDKFCSEWSKEFPLILISEKTGKKIYPENADEKDCKIILIVDPLDGTRELMYNKERCWILSGIAPNKGPDTCLDDIEIAMQTSIRTTRENVDDIFYVVKGKKTCKRSLGFG